MRKIFTTIFTVCVFMSAQAQSNLSPEVNAYLESYKTAAKTRSAEAAKQTIVTLRLKPGAQPSDVASRIEALGAEVKVTLGNQMTVALTGDILEQVAAVEGVDLVERMSKPTNRTDHSRAASHVDEVLDGSGANLPQAYTGEGVIIALIDGGYDFTHPAFKDEKNNLRIKSVYYPGKSVKGSNKATLDGKEADGSLFDKSEMILDTLLLMEEGVHGTHCASCAAGSHIASVTGLTGKPLGGMAPKADLILLNVLTDSIMNQKYGEDAAFSLSQSLALKYISEYAKAQKKPVVLSWSQNSHNGFHDGTSAVAQAVKNFCQEGNIAIVCASNEGDDSIHVHKTLKGGETLKLMMKSTKNAAESFSFFVTQKPVTLRLGVYDVEQQKEVYLSDPLSSSDKIYFALNQAELSGKESAAAKKLCDDLQPYFDGTVWIQLASGTGKDSKGNNRIYVEGALVTDKKDMKKSSYRFVLHYTPDESCELFSWSDGPDPGYIKAEGYTEGSATISMGDYGTTGDAVSIGAWAANNKYIDLNDSKDIKTSKDVVGDIAYFSSWGVDYAGHKFPDACTPGVRISAAINSMMLSSELKKEEISAEGNFHDQFKGQSGDWPYYWGLSDGTSMSTPTAAGIVALWVQAAADKGKTLTNADIKDIFNHSCDTDEFTKAAPHRFGAGKINAYKGLLYVLDLSTGIQGLSQKQPDNITFRVENGQLIAEGAEDGTAVTLYNLSGGIVRQTTVQAGSVSLTGLQKGVYAVQLGKLGSTLIRL